MSNCYVLDASAILALLNNETGADRVQSILENAPCVMSVVNWSEVARKLLGKGLAVEPVAESLQAVGLNRVMVETIDANRYENRDLLNILGINPSSKR